MVDKQCKDTVYITPPRVLEPVRAYFGGEIDLDPATEPNNPTGASAYFTGECPSEDGLLADWSEDGRASIVTARVFVNPPYGPELKPWLTKIREEGAKGCEIIALLPVSRTEQYYMMRTLFNLEADMACFVRKRVNFMRPSGETAKGNPYASVLVGSNCDWTRFKKAFGGLGYCIKIEDTWTTLED